MSTQTSLGFIGAGKLAGSVIRGLLRVNFCEPGAITASQPIDALRAELEAETGVHVTADNLEVIRAAEIIFLGLKPSVILPVIQENAEALRGKLVVSLAAGIRLPDMEAACEARFLRVMTNTPSSIGRGATAIAPGTRSTMEDLVIVKKIFASIGVALQVKEEHIDAVTALAGSGPAFVYSVIEALAAGGEETGLPAEIALALATQTVLGAAQLASESTLSPEELRLMVITPGGTTAAGLEAMKNHATREGLIAAVQAAAARGAEMSRPS